jgi:hypothetical protein
MQRRLLTGIPVGVSDHGYVRPTASFLRHRCDNNAVRQFEQDSYVVRERGVGTDRPSNGINSARGRGGLKR